MERQRPDLSNWAIESLNKHPNRVLTVDFANRANQILGELSDGYPLVSLIAPWSSYVRHVINGEFVLPSKDWENFIDSTTDKEFYQLRKLLERGVTGLDLETAGDMRDFSSRKGFSWRIGPQIGKPFAYLAFRYHYPETIPLGLET